MTKYKLKKDTPLHRAGEIFTKTETTMVASDKYETDTDLIINFDEWFEEVGSPDEWFEEVGSPDEAFCLSVESCVSIVDDGFVPATNVKFPKEHQEQRDKFTEFMEAVRTVSQDDGFMVSYKTLDKTVYGFGISRDWYDVICAEREDHRIIAGQLYFDSEENAAKSVESHLEEWETILNYNWGKGDDDED